MDISFIIVNWKTKELTGKAIESIQKFARGVSYEIIVVDNNSGDTSLPYFQKKFPKITLLPQKENLGFGRANNRGAKVAHGKYLLFLNSDAYLIDDSIEALLKRAGELKNLGALSPLILNPDKTIQQSGGFFPTLPKIVFWMSFLDDLPFGTLLKPYHIDHDGFYKKERELDWQTGAALLIPKKVFESIGGFDEKIFMYGEDVDLCYRIKKGGLKVYMSPVAKIVHIGNASSDKNPRNAILGEYKGVTHFYRKNKGYFSLQLVRILLKMGALARILVFGALGRKELAKTYAEAFKVA